MTLFRGLNPAHLVEPTAEATGALIEGVDGHLSDDQRNQDDLNRHGKKRRTRRHERRHLKPPIVLCYVYTAQHKTHLTVTIKVIIKRDTVKK